ncbi:MAG: NAD(P)-dependent oxidoreductase [Bosea sp.]|nr:NAD(P)-dependent oxidoreductase [Bosea sp. (in: a-proteobacteria)]
MTVLITGGAGFVGLAIAEQLLACGEDIVLFDTRQPPPHALKQFGQAARPVLGDVTCADDIRRALAGCPIDRIVHTAAITAGPQRERTDARSIVDVNLNGTLNVLEQAHEHGGIRRLTMLSSVAVYGFSPPGLSGTYEEQSSCPSPASLYGITKLASEQAALHLGGLYDIDVRVVRLGPVFGPWEHRYGARDAMSPHLQILDQALAGQEVVLPRPMAADWIYSRDAASGIVAVLFGQTLQRRIYNIGAGSTTDLLEWCSHIARHTGLRYRLAEAGEPASIAYNLKQDRPALSTAALAADTGFSARRELAAAASEYLDWTRQLAALGDARP